MKLLQIRFKLDQDEYDILKAHFNTDANTITDLDNSENCWEDVTNASLNYLLKNSLGKGGAASGKGASASTNISTSS